MSAEQLEWRDQVLAYAARINAFVARGLSAGWDKAGPQPPEPKLDHLMTSAVEAIRDANRRGTWSTLRDEWPPAQGPLIPWLEAHGQSIPLVHFLDDGSVVARIGAQYAGGRTVRIQGDSVVELSTVGFFGRAQNRKYFAFARTEGVVVREGWSGRAVTLCPWPRGLEDLPDGFNIAPFMNPPIPTRLIPFPDGSRVLLVSGSGIFVLGPSVARRLLPTREQLSEHFTWLRQKYPDDPLTISLDMEHGAVSNDGRLIAVGDQSSQHLLFNAALQPVLEVPPGSEYPHYACFSADDSVVALNACHFYNGTTVGVSTTGLQAASISSQVEAFELYDGARVYAAVSRRDEFIIGDAAGYIRAFGTDGTYRWQHFIGSSVGDIDISADGLRLAVSTAAGFLSIIRLDAGRQPPYQIGNGNHFEERRWIFWKGEPAPLIW
jgi:hypothetical protein